MRDITKILQALGLLDSEIRTYIAALHLGPSTVLELTKRTKLSRQAVYTAIQQLTGRGLMSSVQREKKTYYTAERPDKLLSYAKRREEQIHEYVKDLQHLVPELELQVGGERPIVKVFEGKEGMRALLEDETKDRPKQLDEITDVDSMWKVLTPEDIEPNRKIVRKYKTKIRTISQKTACDTDQQEQIERITLSGEDAGFHSHISVHGNTITFITFEGKLYSIMIQNKSLAAGLRKLFDLAFRNGR